MYNRFYSTETMHRRGYCPTQLDLWKLQRSLIYSINIDPSIDAWGVNWTSFDSLLATYLCVIPHIKDLIQESGKPLIPEHLNVINYVWKSTQPKMFWQV